MTLRQEALKGNITPEMEQKFKEQVINISNSLSNGQTLERKSSEEERKALFQITTLYQGLSKPLQEGTYATLDLYVMAVLKEQLPFTPLKTTVTIQEIAEAADKFNADPKRKTEVTATVPPAPNPAPPATPVVTVTPTATPTPVAPVASVAPATPPEPPPPSPTPSPTA